MLHPDQGGIDTAARLALREQVIVDFARAQKDPVDLVGRKHIIENLLVTTVGHFVERGDNLRMTQQAFGGHENKGYAEARFDLTPEQMKVLGRGRYIADLHILTGGQLKETCEMPARMVRALSFASMG